MPIHYVNAVSPHGVLAVWNITEPKAYFEEQLDLNEKEIAHVSQLSDRKALEWLSARYLLQMMAGKRSRIYVSKDEHGKPLIANSPYHISISHSQDMAACIASKSVVGIDIQVIVEKIARIAPKFCNEYETERIPKESLLYYHLIWGAKECIYKAYGKRKVDFRQHMRIHDIPEDLTVGQCKGTLDMGNFHQEYHIEYKVLDEAYLLVNCSAIEVI